VIAEMQASLEQRHEMRQPRLSSDTYHLSDDESENSVTLDQAVARNIDIDSAVIDQELSGISEPLNVSLPFVCPSVCLRVCSILVVSMHWKPVCYYLRQVLEEIMRLVVLCVHVCGCVCVCVHVFRGAISP